MDWSPTYFCHKDFKILWYFTKILLDSLEWFLQTLRTFLCFSMSTFHYLWCGCLAFSNVQSKAFPSLCSSIHWVWRTSWFFVSTLTKITPLGYLVQRHNKHLYLKIKKKSPCSFCVLTFNVNYACENLYILLLYFHFCEAITNIFKCSRDF